MRRWRFVRALKVLVVGAAALTALGWVVMSLWNWLMPAVFGLRSIGFFQALGLFLFARLLFGSLRRGGSGHDRWRRRLHHRLEHMTPMERERFVAGVRAGCGRGRSVAEREEDEVMV